MASLPQLLPFSFHLVSLTRKFGESAELLRKINIYDTTVKNAKELGYGSI